MEKSKKEKILVIIVLSVAALLAAAIITVGLVYSGVFDGNAGKVSDGLTDYFDINGRVSEITLKYKDSDGYIDDDKYGDAVGIVGDYAKELYDDKKIEDYHVDDGESVWMRLNGGMEYVYEPPVKETLPEFEQKDTHGSESQGKGSSAISTYQPCMSLFPSELEEWETESVDGAAGKIEEELGDEYTFENNYDNEAVSLDAAANIGTDKVAIWQGHGGYNTETHSFLQTGLKLDEEKYSQNPIEYVKSLGYAEDFLNGRIVLTDSFYAAVTYKFFDEHLDNVQSVVIYLGACSSGKDNVLASTFVNKGAKAVIANTDTIKTVCDLETISYLFDEMTTVSDGKYQTVKTALEKAMSSNESFHNELECISDVKIFGNESTRLSDKEVQTEHTAEDYVYTAREMEIAWNGRIFFIAGERSDEYFSDTDGTATCRLPQLNLTSDDAKEINQEIHDEFDDEFDYNEKWANSENAYQTRIDYRCYLNSSVLSVIIEKRTSISPTSRFYVCNIDVLTGERLNNDDLIQMSSVPSGEASPYDQLSKVIESKYTNASLGDSVSDEQYETIKNQSLSAENLENAGFYFNENGTLCAAYLYYWFAGGGVEGDICELNAEISENGNTTTAQSATVQPTTVQSTTAQPTTQKQDDEWKQLYIDVVESDADFVDSFSLIKLDNDDIPELILSSGSVIPGTQIAWVNDGKAEKQSMGYGGVCYYEKQGLIYCKHLNHGIGVDNVFKLENHSVTNIFQGNYDTPDNPGWSIDGESVSESEYESKFNSVFDVDNAKTPDNSYTKSEIITAINGY